MKLAWLRDELRRGNLVLLGDRVIEVEGISYQFLNPVGSVSFFDHDYDFSGNNFIELRPIVLANDWLKRLGFTCTNKVSLRYRRYTNEADNECVYIQLATLGEPEWMVEYCIGHECIRLKRKIKYVHQAQNVFKELTEQELTAS